MGSLNVTTPVLARPGVTSTGEQFFEADALQVFSDPSLGQHPDYHDGWCGLRPRVVSADRGPHGAKQRPRRDLTRDPAPN